MMYAIKIKTWHTHETNALQVSDRPHDQRERTTGGTHTYIYIYIGF